MELLLHRGRGSQIPRKARAGGDRVESGGCDSRHGAPQVGFVDGRPDVVTSLSADAVAGSAERASANSPSASRIAFDIPVALRPMRRGSDPFLRYSEAFDDAEALLRQCCE